MRGYLSYDAACFLRTENILILIFVKGYCVTNGISVLNSQKIDYSPVAFYLKHPPGNAAGLPGFGSELAGVESN